MALSYFALFPIDQRQADWLVGVAIAVLTACGGGTTEVNETTPEGQQRATAIQAQEMSTRWEQLAASSNSDPVGTLVAELQSNPDVLSVERFDLSGSIIVTRKSGSKFSLSVAEKNRTEWAVVTATPVLVPALAPPNPPPRSFTRHAVPRSELAGPVAILKPPGGCVGLACDPTNFPQSKKACIVTGFQSEFNQDLSSINASLTRAGFTLTAFPLKTVPDLVNLRDNLSSCGVLYIGSHGVFGANLAGTNGSQVVTELELPSDQAAFDALRTSVFGSFTNATAELGMTGHKGKTYFTLGPEFFASATYQNTFVYADACDSDDQANPAANLRKAFRDHGAGGFMGWGGPISTKLSNPAANEIFNALAPSVANITGVTLTITPPAPGPGQSYVVSATISPPAAGVEMALSVRGTDGFTRDETKTTNASGQVTFSSIPGGASAVTDNVTVSAGGAKDSQTALTVLNNNPTLQTAYKLPWSPADGSISKLGIDTRNADFNLACNNANVVKTQAVVKF